MTTQRPTNLQPVCEVEGCKEGAQILNLQGTTATWMRTCSRHTYKDLPGEQEKLETFWPPETDK
jgi:hypothetical protein